MEVRSYNVPHAYADVMSVLKVAGVRDSSEKGDVIRFTTPFLLTIEHPEQRVLFDPVRNANPFFHLMEAIWMFAGQDNVEWLLQFNKRMANYADFNRIRGAYGYRWLRQFGVDQVDYVIQELQRHHRSRRAVINMWDPAIDTEPGFHDYPCNTQLMFQVGYSGGLDMTVINRSNDLVWGALGSNAVHFTLLHEVIAGCTGYHLGDYRLFSNNAHVYLDQHRHLVELTDPVDKYLQCKVEPLNVKDWWKFRRDSEAFVAGNFESLHHPFLSRVAHPMFELWTRRNEQRERDEQSDGGSSYSTASGTDWWLAGREYLQRTIATSRTAL